jgi:pimeloyl-ACP methyl ester carboxylesterase
MLVDLVSAQTRDGVRLDGTFRKPAQEQASQLGVDVVILHHGVGGNFYHPGMFDAYSDALLDVGCAVLRVNNRGHDLVSRALVSQPGHEPEAKRLGAAYEDMDACRHDWAAWVDFAHAAGYRRIGLWGHSLGATKSIYYMATQPDARVTCVVAGSPPRFAHSAFLTTAEGAVFKRSADLAQQHIQEGHPEAMMDVLYPVPLLLTAETFMQKYGPEETYDILTYLPKLHIPTLILIGTEEAQTMMAFQGLPSQVAKLSAELDPLTFASIPGADHAYTHQRGEVWDIVRQWLAAV